MLKARAELDIARLRL